MHTTVRFHCTNTTELIFLGSEKAKLFQRKLFQGKIYLRKYLFHTALSHTNISSFKNISKVEKIILPYL